MILVGNKQDMEHERVVIPNRGQELANQLGFEFYEVSAKSGNNVQNVLEHFFLFICNFLFEK